MFCFIVLSAFLLILKMNRLSDLFFTSTRTLSKADFWMSPNLTQMLLQMLFPVNNDVNFLVLFLCWNLKSPHMFLGSECKQNQKLMIMDTNYSVAKKLLLKMVYNLNFNIFFCKKAWKVLFNECFKKVVYFWHCVTAICDSFSLLCKNSHKRPTQSCLLDLQQIELRWGALVIGLHYFVKCCSCYYFTSEKRLIDYSFNLFWIRRDLNLWLYPLTTN